MANSSLQPDQLKSHNEPTSIGISVSPYFRPRGAFPSPMIPYRRTDKARPPMADHQQWMAAHYHAVRPRHDLDSRFVNWSAHSQKMGPLSLITSQTQT
ncbi:hypothetical protein LB506_003642 [Fusarium annulatum]|nr:hypothetical protein LB506_003642 [Fusarium annulatum]